MTKKHLEVISTMEKTISINCDNIADALYTKLTIARMSFGGGDFVPIGIILGPMEYLALVAHFNTNPYLPKSMEIEVFMGVPIRLKQSPGIDLEFKHQCVSAFAPGVVK